MKLEFISGKFPWLSDDSTLPVSEMPKHLIEAVEVRTVVIPFICERKQKTFLTELKITMKTMNF
jgi:hypothetical protein